MSMNIAMMGAVALPGGGGGGSPYITPTNIVGGSFTSDVFTKSGGIGWNAGFSSVESISGDGFIEWTATENTKGRMVGLSTSDPNQNYTSQQYTFYYYAGGLMQIYESGVLQVDAQSYVANTTVFKIAREGTVLTYYKNGIPQRSVTGVTTSPLYVDAIVDETGGTIGPITMTSGTVTRTPFIMVSNEAKRVGGTFSSNVFTKTAGTNWNNSGFSSNQSIVGDGYMEFTVTEITKYRIVGLSVTDPNTNYNSVLYGWYPYADGSVSIIESGTAIDGVGTLVANTTVLKIARAGTTLTYYLDGVSKRVVTGVTTSPLIVDAALYDTAGTVGPVTMFF